MLLTSDSAPADERQASAVRTPACDGEPVGGASPTAAALRPDGAGRPAGELSTGAPPGVRAPAACRCRARLLESVVVCSGAGAGASGAPGPRPAAPCPRAPSAPRPSPTSASRRCPARSGRARRRRSASADSRAATALRARCSELGLAPTASSPWTANAVDWAFEPAPGSPGKPPSRSCWRRMYCDRRARRVRGGAAGRRRAPRARRRCRRRRSARPASRS